MNVLCRSVEIQDRSDRVMEEQMNELPCIQFAVNANRVVQNILPADCIPNFYGIAAITIVADGSGGIIVQSCHTSSVLGSI